MESKVYGDFQEFKEAMERTSRNNFPAGWTWQHDTDNAWQHDTNNGSDNSDVSGSGNSGMLWAVGDNGQTYAQARYDYGKGEYSIGRRGKVFPIDENFSVEFLTGLAIKDHNAPNEWHWEHGGHNGALISPNGSVAAEYNFATREYVLHVIWNDGRWHPMDEDFTLEALERRAATYEADMNQHRPEGWEWHYPNDGNIANYGVLVSPDGEVAAEYDYATKEYKLDGHWRSMDKSFTTNELKLEAEQLYADNRANREMEAARRNKEWRWMDEDKHGMVGALISPDGEVAAGYDFHLNARRYHIGGEWAAMDEDFSLDGLKQLAVEWYDMKNEADKETAKDTAKEASKDAVNDTAKGTEDKNKHLPEGWAWQHTENSQRGNSGVLWVEKDGERRVHAQYDYGANEYSVGRGGRVRPMGENFSPEFLEGLAIRDYNAPKEWRWDVGDFDGVLISPEGKAVAAYDFATRSYKTGGHWHSMDEVEDFSLDELKRRAVERYDWEKEMDRAAGVAEGKAAKGITQDAVRDTGKDTVQDAAEGVTQDAGKDVIQNAAQDTAQNGPSSRKQNQGQTQAQTQSQGQAQAQTQSQTQPRRSIPASNSRYTKEQYEAANRQSMVGYLESIGHPITKEGSAWYRSKVHKSLVVDGSKNWFYWNDKDIKSGKPVELAKLMNIERGYGEKEALIKAVNDLAGSYSPDSYSREQGQGQSSAYHKPNPNNHYEEKKPLTPPEANDNNVKAINYLRSRGIDAGIIAKCIDAGMIYQTKKYLNVAFVSHDKEGNPQHIFLRGTSSYKDKQTGEVKTFRRDAPGSTKAYPFALIGNANADKVFVFESSIDALSHATLYKMNGGDGIVEKAHRISLHGTSTGALATFLSENPNVKTIIPCLDNDEAGRRAAVKMKKEFGDKGYDVVDHKKPHAGKDYNEMLLNCEKHGLKSPAHMGQSGHGAEAAHVVVAAGAEV